jgi:hypothetical protein
MNDRTARRFTAGLLLGSLAIGGCHGPGSSPESDGPGRSVSPQAAPRAPELAGLFPASASGSEALLPRRSYGVQLKATLTPQNPQGSVPERVAAGSELRVTGTWSATLVGREGESSVFLAELGVKELEVTAPESAIVTPAEYRARFADELSRPLLVKQDARGRITGLKSEPRRMAAALAAARSIVAAAQTSAPGAGERKWLADEEDAGGRFRAQYERTGEHAFLKKKSEYLEIDSGEGLRPPKPDEFRVLTSEAKLASSTSGAMTRVVLTETLNVNPGPGLPPLTSSTFISLDLASEERVARPSLQVSALEGSDWAPLHRQPPQEAHEFEIDLTKAGNYVSVGQILAELDRLDVRKNADDGDRQKRLQIALTALFRLKPASVKDAAAALTRRRRHSDVLLRALAASGTEESQRVVLGMLLTPTPELVGKARAEVLANVSLVRTPSPELVRGLKQLLADPQLEGQALLGLGSAAFRLRRDEPARSREIIETLATELERATKEGSFKRASLVFKAFGNAGHPEMIGMLQPYLTASQYQVRAAAVAALRRIDNNEVDHLLEAYLASDTSADVRKAAQRTLDDRRKRQRAGSDAG